MGGGPYFQGVGQRCDVCRFDPGAFTDQDTKATIRTAMIRWEWTVDGVEAASLDDLATHLAGVLAAADDHDRDAAHAVEHTLTLAGRTVAASRPATGSGTVVGLFANGGGVPKLSIPEAEIGYRGVAGDRQAERVHHGRTWQALCLMSGDVIDALRAEGHSIRPGATGENVTVAGVDWATLRPGTRVGIGRDVVAQISSYSTPCKKNAQWFADGDFRRIDHGRHPGWSRLYASVLADGVVRPGDEVVIEP
jgi:MOSC domain-containing protein YiiM